MTMGRKWHERLRGWLRLPSVSQSILSIAWVIAGFTVLTGMFLTLAPDVLATAHALRFAFEFAPPHLWGLAFLAVSAWLMTELVLFRNRAAGPLFIITFLVGSWAFFTAQAALAGIGSATAVWAYLALGAIAAITGLGLTESEDDSEW